MNMNIGIETEPVSATGSIFFTHRNNTSLLNPKSVSEQDRPNS